MSEVVLTEVKDGVLIVTINRPEAKNAINGAVAKGIAKAMDLLDGSDDIVVGVLKGAGGTFSAGMDLKAYLQGDDPNVKGRGFGGLTDAPPKKPLIGALEGFVLAGGLELSLACDLTVCGKTTKFGIPETKVGLVAAAGGVARLPRLVPKRIAMEMALTGDMIGSGRAYEIGLVNRVVEDGAVIDEALKLAQTIAANAPLAVAASKRVVNECVNWHTDELMANQMDIIKPIFTSNDAIEGPKAFAEKRKPNWTGT